MADGNRYIQVTIVCLKWIFTFYHGKSPLNHHVLIFFQPPNKQNPSNWGVGALPYMGVSLNGGTPKSSILIGFSILNHPFWGTPIFGNTHIQHTLKHQGEHGHSPEGQATIPISSGLAMLVHMEPVTLPGRPSGLDPTDVFPRIRRQTSKKSRWSTRISKTMEMNHEILIGSLWDPYNGLL